MVEWSVTDAQVVLVLLGPDAPGDPALLADELSEVLAMPVHLTIRYLPETVTEAASTP